MVFNINNPSFYRLNKIDRVKRLQNSREREERGSFEEELEEELSREEEKEDQPEKKEPDMEDEGNKEETKPEKPRSKYDLGGKLDIKV